MVPRHSKHCQSFKEWLAVVGYFVSRHFFEQPQEVGIRKWLVITMRSPPFFRFSIDLGIGIGVCPLPMLCFPALPLLWRTHSDIMRWFDFKSGDEILLAKGVVVKATPSLPPSPARSKPRRRRLVSHLSPHPP